MHKTNDNEENITSNAYTDFTCPICLQILIEPVVMPCEHELCKPCFKQNVEEANFLCPLCRMRISSWARKNSRSGTLVNLKRWEQIQKRFPEKCKKRLRGEEDEDLFDLPPLKRAISQDGEIRKEYEEEIRKLQQAREQELRASEDAIRQLQEEESRLVRSLEHQAIQDEQLARKIISEEKEQNSQGKEKLLQPSTSRTQIVTSNVKSGKGKKPKQQKNQATHGCSTLDKWFSSSRMLPVSGFEKRSRVLITNQSCQSGFTCISDDINDLQFSQVMNERKEQEDADFQFALKLQKEFDLTSKKAAEVDRKKGTVDAYLLRNVDQVETSSDCSANQLNV